jgi:putative colanic acid biosynthesis UDP-glucose lipid carrier transferase
MYDKKSQLSTGLNERKQKNIFLLGSQDEYRILKSWAENNVKSHLHLNGWYHDKDIPTTSEDLINKYEFMAGDSSVDHFVLDPSDMDPEMLQASIDWAESRGSRIHLIQSGTTLVTPKLDKLNKFGPFAAVPLRQEPLTLRRNQLKKKVFDYVLSMTVLLGLFWWFYPLVGLFIKLAGKGPIIIRQDRIGIDGLKFKCMKFRTMVSDKSAEKGYSHLTSDDDNRITWIGKILRKTNFDEFPQFINVLRGYMSVVGPRPHMVSEDREIADKIDKYRIRRFVKPGITGLAAIEGYRGGTENLELMQKRIDHDIEYIENWSIWLDVKIAVITFWQMITFNTGAH